MKNLIKQFMKFGVVGVICFAIDYVIGFATMKFVVRLWGASAYETGSLVGSALGFIISVIVNYILSFKFVFERKEDMDRRAEFVIFITLSTVGLLINSLVIWLHTAPLFSFFSSAFTWGWGLFGMTLTEDAAQSLVYTFGKLVATAVVMVYNFVTRKIFLEKN